MKTTTFARDLGLNGGGSDFDGAPPTLGGFAGSASLGAIGACSGSSTFAIDAGGLIRGAEVGPGEAGPATAP